MARRDTESQRGDRYDFLQTFLPATIILKNSASLRLCVIRLRVSNHSVSLYLNQETICSFRILVWYSKNLSFHQGWVLERSVSQNQK